MLCIVEIEGIVIIFVIECGSNRYMFVLVFGFFEFLSVGEESYGERERIVVNEISVE